MSDFFLGEIRAFSFSWAPDWWAQCNGQIMTIQQNQALYALLGVTFGGNATTNFQLPDMRGRGAYGAANVAGQQRGNKFGSEGVTLTTTQIPPHTHTLNATTTGADTPDPTGGIMAQFAQTDNGQPAPAGYGPLNTPVPLNAGLVGVNGGGQTHSNMQPFTVVNFCIATQGLFPSRQ
ncbi:tail fiber protein [Azospirillum sp. Sh1]|uniref:phage tail protein n=1 Tax=Azospirillum sp. Sh1 TaxID=2607285 RepID=UPI0011EFD976|nr:tail fiber protein [Azospirillum sp. Sh1]KAA0579289.1 phage tail protein [Azospirillum sp. Sh1]